jgi:hypothetical protein
LNKEYRKDIFGNPGSPRDPKLGSLASNGGPTRTHTPTSDSPVLGKGTNAVSSDYDQRGSGYPRKVGTNVDIGSVER